MKILVGLPRVSAVVWRRVLWGVLALLAPVFLVAPPGASAVTAARFARGSVTSSRGPVMLLADGPYLHTDGGLIRDARGHPVRLGGVNWSGLETCLFAPSGLGQRSWGDVLDQVRTLGFNTIRLPYSDQTLDPANRPQGINMTLNPDLQGLSTLEVMDHIVAGAGRRGLRVILDRHRPTCAAQAPLWYSAQDPERSWIAALVFLARHYRHEPAMIGLDLFNEPQPPATRGDGNRATDWRLAAERAGNAVLRANPRLLILVEGIGTYRQQADWWGGNLLWAGAAPVRLAVPHRLVYAPHDYGPGLALQPWFSAPDFPRNLPRIWDQHWGYLQEQNIASVVLGEFGGQALAPPFSCVPPRPIHLVIVGPASGAAANMRERAYADTLWQRALLSYLASHCAIGFLYWSLMPDSPDVGSLLNDDGQTANITKEAALAPLQGAAMPLPRSAPALAALRVLGSDQVVSLNQQNLTLRIVNDGARPLDLRRTELRYWLGRGVRPDAEAPQRQRTAEVDGASTGSGTVTIATGFDEDHGYVALRFIAPSASSAASVVLAPYGDVAVIALRLHRRDWLPYMPRGDWSFSASALPAPVLRLTLTVDGRLVWGRVPPPGARP